MKIIDVKRRPLNVKEYKSRYAKEDDASILINEDCMLVEDGSPILLYKKIDWCDTSDLLKVCKSTKYTEATRLPKKEGDTIIKTRSAIFGFKPRNPLRRQDYCSATVMSVSKPIEHNILTGFAENLTDVYRTYFPDTYKHHELKANTVKDIWRMKNSVFTSGIINKNNPLLYHHDTGNFKGVLSNMIAFKKDISGGRLVLPEYDIKLEIADNTLSIFDGQSIVHGVTPLVKTSKDAHRYTIVYYSLEQMWKCDTIKDEIIRARALAKKREHQRIKNNSN